MTGEATKVHDSTYKSWIDLPENDLRQMLIALVGFDFGPEPETRIPEIRESRRTFANYIADKCRIGKEDIVLDLGSGCGFGTYWLAQRAKHVYACDISPAYLKFASAECSGLENVSFHLIESRKLEFLERDALDVVSSMSVFIHFNLYDIFWYFDEFARVVKSGGRVWIDVADSESLDLSSPNTNGKYFLTHAEGYKHDESQLSGLMQWNSLNSVIGIADHAGFRNIYKESGGQLLFEKRSVNLRRFDVLDKMSNENQIHRNNLQAEGFGMGASHDVAEPTAERMRLVGELARLEKDFADRATALLKQQQELEAKIADRDKQIVRLENAQSGLLWDLFCFYREAKDRCFPPASRRRMCYDAVLNSLKASKRALRNLARLRPYSLLRSIYRRLPLSPRSKQRLKAWVRRSLPSSMPFPGLAWPPTLPYDGDFSREVRQRPAGSPISVLFLSHWLPAMDRASGGLRTFTILQLLREQGYNVAFGADREKSEHIWFFGSEEEVSRYEAILGGLGISVLYGSRDVIRHLREQGDQYDFVLLSFPEVTYRYLPCARAFAFHAKVIYDPVDLTWVRMEREARLKNDDGLRKNSENYKQVEVFNAAAADTVIAITPEEKAEILKEVPSANVELIPNIHDCLDIAKPLTGRKDLFFIGHFLHTPNEDAVVYFVKEIFPLIRRQLPEVGFYIIGSNMTETIKSLAGPGVFPIGYVPDPSVYFNGCRVFVAPLRYGAGMKGKIGQSMSFGLPVVTTSIGAEGMHLIDGKQVLIADSPKAFAKAVVQLYTDDMLWEKISADSLSHVRTHFSKAVVGEKLKQVLANGSGSASVPPDPVDTMDRDLTLQAGAKWDG